MNVASKIFVLLVAVEHLWFLVLEMFLWTKPIGLKTFGLTAEAAASSATLAMNQGLYNGFLSAGLLWGLTRGREGTQIVLFFLGCVITAGLFGGATVKISVLFVQAVPATIALVLVILDRRSST